ncbi:hypothetical protein NVS55_40140 (plasmid) [Myxococcus stipitatus]|uniref:hypothetical protein n=1 Tax=Myxococcus stipitatus TaxID=83455 RepID=UPI0031453925
MTALPLLLAAVLLAAPAAQPAASSPAPSGTEESAGTIRSIEIDEAKTSKVYRVRTSISVHAIVELPEDFESPVACGDCAVEPPPSAPPEVVEEYKASQALFVLVPQPEQRYLLIRPKQYPRSMGGVIPDEDFLTTVTIRLKSKLTLTLQVEYAPKSSADARVVFTLPNRTRETAYVRDLLAKERAALESQYAERVLQGAHQALLTALLEPHQCAPSSARTRVDKLVLEVKEICRFGARLFIRFEVENRDRQTATLGDVAIVASLNGAAAAELPELGLQFSAQDLAFNGTATGIASADVGDTASRIGALELRLTERGGKGRALSVPGLAF